MATGVDPDLEERAADLERRIVGAGGWASNGWTDEASLRGLLGIPARTWRDWRARGDAPPRYELHRALYDLIEVAEWLLSRKSAAAGGGERRRAADRDVDGEAAGR